MPVRRIACTLRFCTETQSKLLRFFLYEREPILVRFFFSFRSFFFLFVQFFRFFLLLLLLLPLFLSSLIAVLVRLFRSFAQPAVVRLCIFVFVVVFSSTLNIPYAKELSHGCWYVRSVLSLRMLSLTPLHETLFSEHKIKKKKHKKKKKKNECRSNTRHRIFLASISMCVWRIHTKYAIFAFLHI